MEVATQEVQTVLAVGVQVVDRNVPAAQLLQAMHTAFTATVHRGEAYVDPATHVVQAVQVAALVVVLNVEPAMQATQPVLAATVHSVERRVPAAQFVQAVQAAAFVVVEYVLPATQAVQTRFTVTVH